MNYEGFTDGAGEASIVFHYLSPIMQCGDRQQHCCIFGANTQLAVGTHQQSGTLNQGSVSAASIVLRGDYSSVACYLGCSVVS